jgi:hypothetical protein
VSIVVMPVAAAAARYIPICSKLFGVIRIVNAASNYFCSFPSKVWSPFQLPGYEDRSVDGGRTINFNDRPTYSHDDYIEMMIRGSGSPAMMTHDYSHQSTEEDPRMIAFFDSLVRREREELATDDAHDDDDDDDDSDLGMTTLFDHSELSSSADDDSADEPRDNYRRLTALAQSVARTAWYERTSAEIDDANADTVILIGRRAGDLTSRQKSNGQIENDASRPEQWQISNGESCHVKTQSDRETSSSSSSSSSSSLNSSPSSSGSSSSSEDDDDVRPSRGVQSPKIEFDLPSSSSKSGSVAASSRTTTNFGCDTSAKEKRSIESLCRLKQLRKRILRDDDDEERIMTSTAKTARLSVEDDHAGTCLFRSGSQPESESNGGETSRFDYAVRRNGDRQGMLDVERVGTLQAVRSGSHDGIPATESDTAELNSTNVPTVFNECLPISGGEPACIGPPTNGAAYSEPCGSRPCTTNGNMNELSYDNSSEQFLSVECKVNATRPRCRRSSTNGDSQIFDDESE